MFYQNLPESTLEIDRMNFRMPDHTKIMFASGKVREHWQLLVNEASSAWVEIEKLSLIEGYRDSILIYADNWKQWKQWADDNDLIIIPLNATSINGYSSYGGSSGNTWRSAIVRDKEIAAEWMDVWQDGNDREIGTLLGYPDCCRKFFHQYWVEEEFRDLTVPAIMSHGIEGPPEANILGRWAGIRLVSHMPCSFQCEKSIEIGKEMAEIGRKNGFERQVDLIYQLLNMPYKYSSLHGIAEISTPIWKVSAASEPYPEEIVYDRKGEIPEMSASGKQFPFSNQAKSEVTASPSFKRAIEHYKSGSEVDFDIRFDLNGFSTLFGQSESHQPILNLIDDKSKTTVDFGCGNGALLSKIKNITEKDVKGIDKNKEAILYGYIEWGLDIQEGDMFDHFLEGDTAIVMPGRLQETTEKKKSSFLNHLESFSFIIAYAYSDWIQKIDFDSVFGDGWVKISEEENDHCKAVKFQNIEKL